MNLKVVKESRLEQPDIGYFKGKSPSTIEPMVKFKKVSMRKGKKSVVELFGELVQHEGSSDVKVLLPIMETTELGMVLKVKSGDFFMGKMQVQLSNPRKVIYEDVVMFDVKFI